MELSQQELEEFKVESFELLDMAESNLLTYDTSGDYQTTYNCLFRAFHSLKGSCGMMGLNQLQELLHRLENLLVTTKEKSVIDKSQIEIFLEGIDKAKKLFAEMTLAKLNQSAAAAQAPAATSTVENQAPIVLSEATLEFVCECVEISQRVSKVLQQIEKGVHSEDDIDSLYRDIHTLKGSSYLFEYKQLGDLGHSLESSLDPIRRNKTVPSATLVDHMFKCLDLIDRMVNDIGKGQPLQYEDEVAKCIMTLNLLNHETKSHAAPVATSVATTSATVVPVSAPVATAQAAAPAVATPVSATPVSAPSAHDSSSDKESASSVRVSVALLDKLMILMGEMVLVRNQVIQYSNRTDDLEFLNLSQRLNVVTTEIQGEMMKTRMQPIGNVLTKFTRVVRDLSKELGKKIDISLSGNETELDKTLLEAVKDPLTHIIRNACDHGIENPDIRKSKGKPEAGLIQVKSYHEGGQVIVEVQDDGGGLNKDRILAKAIEKQIITAERAKLMADRDIYSLIFAPGFSTSTKVTNLSGRGVGMDVVRTNIEKIGGTVELNSELDFGTSIKLKIPLTLAIVPALIVRSAEENFAIPQLKLVELVRVEKSSETQIEFIQGNPVFRLRGKILPLISLNKVLHLNDHFQLAEATNIIVLKSDEYVFGLIVDEVQDTADIVVKPLSRFLKPIDIYSGATVLGDGSVALILDVAGLAKNHLLSLESSQQSTTRNLDLFQEQRALEDIQDFLLIKVASSVKHAILLNYVHRLEEFKKHEFERTAHKTIVRYRGGVLPIISINNQIGLTVHDGVDQAKEIVPVIVIEKAGLMFGLMVDEILDVYKTEKALDTSITEENGIIGHLVTDQEVFTVLDPYKMINIYLKQDDGMVHEYTLEEKRAHQATIKQSVIGNEKILFVDDTVFFRRHVAKELEKAGYEVTTAKDGVEALQILESNNFHLILSDIEMPNMNGFKLAENIRRNPKIKHLPLIALSTRADEVHIKKGLECGFDLYLEKMNVEQVLKSISKLKLKDVA